LGKGLSKSRLERTGLDRCRRSIRFKARSLNPPLQASPTPVIFLSPPGGTTTSLEGKATGLGRRPLPVQTTCDRRGANDPIMPTLVSGCFESASANCVTALEGGEQAEHGAFSPLALPLRKMRQANPLAPPKSATVEIGRGRGIGEAASRRTDATFVDHGRDVGRWDSFSKDRRKVAVVRHLWR